MDEQLADQLQAPSFPTQIIAAIKPGRPAGAIVPLEPEGSMRLWETATDTPRVSASQHYPFTTAIRGCGTLSPSSSCRLWD
ncbi:hypothetical protein NKJ52_31510 [Mesorhizobium australicum]|uniref:hypothetical protein n=1 Tax=Mesorhizobium australicum TaxID=536018 RepID=UPI0033377E18